MCCEDPLDFSLWILKLLAKCFGGQISSLLCLIRVVLGLVFDFAEATLLATEIMNVFEDFEDGAYVTVVALVVLLVFFIASMITLAFLWGYSEQDGLDADERRKRRNRFFVVFKTLNVIFAAILTAGAVYGWEEIDIGNLLKEPDGAKIFFVVSLGVDVIFDPFELLIAYCVVCRN